MVSNNSRCCISIQSLSRNAGGMTVHRLPPFLGEHQLIQVSIRSCYHARKIHKFSDTQNVLGVNEFPHFLRINHCTGMLKHRSRNTGRKHIPDIQLCILGCINHVLKTDEAAYIHNLMGICDNGGSPMRNHQSSQLFRRKIGRLYMDMAVDKARRSVGSCPIHHFLSFIVPYSCNHALCNRYISFRDFSGKNIDNLTVFNQKIRRDSSGSNINQVL